MRKYLLILFFAVLLLVRSQAGLETVFGNTDPMGVIAPFSPAESLIFRVDQSLELCDYAHIQGGRVVFEDHRGPGIEIYGVDLHTSQEFLVIHDTPHQHFPVIYGDIVAYTDLRYSTTGLDGTDIFARNLVTGQEITVTTAPGQQIKLAISDHYIVWEDDRDGETGSKSGSKRDIYGFDLHTGVEFKIAGGSAAQIHPDIDGSVVVWSENGHIVGKDLSTGESFTVSDYPSNKLRPAIYGDLVVWEDWRSGDWDLYAYRFSTEQEFPLVVATDDQQFAAISDQLIVWMDRRYGNWDIFVHVIETGDQFPISRNTRHQKWPSVDGNTVVWSDFKDLEPHIYGFQYNGIIPEDADYEIAGNPTNLIVGAYPDGLIRLTWKDNSEDETGFVIERQVGMAGDHYETLVTLPANTEAYDDLSTETNTPYWYRVYAVNESGRSATSNESYNFALPGGPFPNLQETYMLVLINELRSDPAKFGYSSYASQPPVIFNANMNYAARAHAAVSVLPGGSGGHVDWADRGPGDRAMASGYENPYVSENMATYGGPSAAEVEGVHLSFLNSHGHRDNLLTPGVMDAGLGYFYSTVQKAGSWVETFSGFRNPDPQMIPAAAVVPFDGTSDTTFTYIANYYSSQGQAPSSAKVFIDGAGYNLSLSTGKAHHGTYRYSQKLAVGPHEYYFLFTYGSGLSARWPEAGAIQFPTVRPKMPDVEPGVPQIFRLTAGIETTLSAAVHNRGEIAASDVAVRFYQGDPQTSGQLIGEVIIASITPGTSAQVSLTFTPLQPGWLDLYVWVDPENHIVESNEDNNLSMVRAAVRAGQFIWYVNGSVTQSGDGRSPQAAFKSIVMAIEQAWPGDTIQVAPGVYRENVSLPEGIILRGSGFDKTTIQGSGAGSVVNMAPGSTLKGFAITGSGSGYFDAGIWHNQGQITVRNNLFKNNSAGIFTWCWDSSCAAQAAIENNVFMNNLYSGVDANGWAVHRAVNNIFCGSDRGLNLNNPASYAANNILCENRVGLNGISQAEAHYNLYWENQTNHSGVSPGTGNIYADPLFIDFEEEYFHLQPGSPAVDAGHPHPQFNDLDGSRNDIGVYGGPYADFAFPNLSIKLLAASPRPTSDRPITIVLRVTNTGGGVRNLNGEVSVSQKYLFVPGSEQISRGSVDLGESLSLLVPTLPANGQVDIQFQVAAKYSGGRPDRLPVSSRFFWSDGEYSHTIYILVDGYELFVPLIP
jgi:beta propeller repeat protein